MVAVRWAFTGRAHELATAVDRVVGTATVPASSVLIVGRRGTGKSTLADEVVKRGAEAGDGAHGIVRVDDVEMMSATDADLLAASIAGGRRVVMTAASISALPASTASLVRSGRIGVVSLRELSRSETIEVVTTALGAPLTGRLASALWRLSYGSLSALTAVVEASLTTGHIHKSSGRWDYAGELDLSAVEVALASRIRLLTAEQSEALFTVALCEPISAALLHRLVPESVVDVLYANGFVDIATMPGFGDALFAAVTPPAHGDILRSSVPPGLGRPIVRRVLDVEADDPHEPVRPITWALANGEVVSGERAVRAAARASRFHDYRSTVRICTAVIAAGARGDILEGALLHRAVALRHLTRFDDAVADIERLRELLTRSYTPPASEMWGERWASMATAYADIVHGADLECGPALAVIDDCARLVDPDSGVHGRNTRRHLAALRVQHQAYAGRFVSALAEYDKLGRLPSPFRQRLDVITAIGLVDIGASRLAGARVADAFRQADTGVDAPWLTEELVGARFLTTLRSAGPAAAMALAVAHDATDRHAVVRWDDGMRALADAELRMAAGDIAGAREHAGNAVAIIEEEGPHDYLARALSLTAEAAAFSGDHIAAARTAARARATPGLGNSVFAADIEVSLTTVDVLAPTGDVRQARDVAASFADQGRCGTAARMLHLAVRLGDGAAAGELVALADALDGDLETLYSEHARAVSIRDGGALLKVSTEFLHRGLALVAAEAAQAARAVSLAQSQHDMAAAAERHALMLHGILDFETVVTLRESLPSPDVPTLTRREQEIATLVASGMSNRDIASTLGVSVRTVEGHLARMYAKLGISGRRGLKDTRWVRAGARLG